MRYRYQRALAGCTSGNRAAGPDARRHRVHHLHLGNHRHTERCCHRAPKCARAVRRTERPSTVRYWSGVGAVAFIQLRCLGMGNLRCAAARRVPAGGDGTGGGIARGTSSVACHATRQRIESDTFGSRDDLAAGTGIDGIGGGGRGLPTRTGGPLGARAGDGQRLRADGGHGVCIDKRTTAERESGTDRRPGAGSGSVRTGPVDASGPAWCGRRVIRGGSRCGPGLLAPDGADIDALRGLPLR
ncbi:Uncharacterised protein [Mycobacteroides abscessus subsp. bolletii]|nr:Uncharacterised protein [Mycobacteroides abscessus subsp. abscessus]SKH62814.1 Uncharacterised protein [Mycobacteroides abscessus subsp. bolletii]